MCKLLLDISTLSDAKLCQNFNLVENFIDLYTALARRGIAGGCDGDVRVFKYIV